MTAHEVYPKRPPYFAQKAIRLLVKTCAAQEIGQAATLLVVTVATTEDAARYRRAVTFYNDQILPLLGLRKWDALEKARKSAIASGWLHYEPPPQGKRKPGRYWVTIPAEAEGLEDSPVDEPNTEVYPSNGDSQPTPYPANGYSRGYGDGDSGGDGRGELSELSLNPSPKKIRSKLRFEPADLTTAKWMFGLIQHLDRNYRQPNFKSWANDIRLTREKDGRTDEQIRDVFRWANSHEEFWQAQILSPGKLREKFTALLLQMNGRQNGHARKNCSPVGVGQRHPDDAAQVNF